ncbi:MAG: hypothetical protein ABIP02_01175 [Arenimonas sp.]
MPTELKQIQILLILLCTLLAVASCPVLATPAITEPITIRFISLSPETGLTLSITTPGDTDGSSTFANENCCGIEDAQKFIRDVNVNAGGKPLEVIHNALGWTVTHKPREMLTIVYRLPPSGPMKIDGGTITQMIPIVRKDLFHLIGTTALLLPTGRGDSDPVVLEIDARSVAKEKYFVSSFSPSNYVQGLHVSRHQLMSALYLGGEITLSLHKTPEGTVGVVYSGMAKGVRGDELRRDALAIVAMERKFFGNGQAWYLVSVHGGIRDNPQIYLGGGTGLTNSFAMFVTDSLDFSNAEHREQFRWVLAHEYFHQWNGLTLRVASLPQSGDDDASTYWFSEGVTEFYTMRLLTRAGLQSSARSLDILNNKLSRYASNNKRGVSAQTAGTLFWTDPDGEQIPYLRGYLAAWYADIALSRHSQGNNDFDSKMKALVTRAKLEPRFRVGNAFLVKYLSNGMSDAEAKQFRNFVINGAAVPLDANSFSPCLKGKKELFSGQVGLRFNFAVDVATSCFQH